MKGCLKELMAAVALLFCIVWGVGAGAVGGAAAADYLSAGWLSGLVIIACSIFGLLGGVFVGFLCLEHLQKKSDCLSFQKLPREPQNSAKIDVEARSQGSDKSKNANAQLPPKI